MQYTELHLHDHYSVLDGVGTPAEYMARAKELGMTHLAQTNHGTPAGWREFQKEAKAAGIVPILGLESYISATDRFDRRTTASRQDGTKAFNHIGTLAINEVGLKNLTHMNYEAWTSGFYNKPRIDFDLLEEFNEGIIVLSGCLGGLLCSNLDKDDYDTALAHAKRLQGIFGERFFIEVQTHNSEKINAGLVRIGEQINAKLVVTSDCHHVRKEDLWLQDAMLILSTNPKRNFKADMSTAQKMEWMERWDYLYPDRTMTFKDFGLHLNSAAEHLAGLEKHGIGREAIDNTQVIARMIGEYPFHQGLDLLPRPKGDAGAILRAKVFAGLKAKGLDENPVYVERANHELPIIHDKGFDSYFLITEDAVTWARSQGIRVGPGRGSAAGSLVCYALGITDVDPIKHNLLFFRFIDPDRDDYPDADIDFEDKRRWEVKAYVARKFGHVASVATFGYFKDSGAVRAAARALCIPIADVNRALKNVDTWEQFLNHPTTLDFRRKYPEVIKLAEGLRGRINTVGMHAGGLVMSKEPLANHVPMITATDTNDKSAPRVAVVAQDKKQVEDIGLIKLDFLGLKGLSVLEDALRLIEKRHGNYIDVNTIPLDDKRVYEMLSDGYTKGVFQCEASPYTKLLVNMGGVKNFDELAASNALVRPGSANASFGAAFIKGKNGGGYEYIHADTKWFTDETYGQIIYQEQQMYLCTEVAGMSMRDANKVRRAIGKKIAADLAVWENEFIDGATKKIGKAKAVALWKDLEAAADYSFNKSHAVAYSLVSYWTAWLKLNYPIEFMTATLINESDKDSILDYLVEAKRLGIRILLPNVNISEASFSIQKDDKGDHIRMGLSNIKYISDKLAGRLIEKRPFTSYAHLADTVMTKGSGLNTRVLQSLNAIGGAVFPDNPRRGDERDNYFEYLNIPAFKDSELPPRVLAQIRTLDEYTENEAFFVMAMVRKVVSKDNWMRVDVVDETGTAGIFCNPDTPIETSQRYVMLVSNNSIANMVKVEELASGEYDDWDLPMVDYLLGKTPQLAEDHYWSVQFSHRKTKAGDNMAGVVLMDEDKRLHSAIVFPKQYRDAFLKLITGSVAKVQFKETKDGALVVDKIGDK